MKSKPRVALNCSALLLLASALGCNDSADPGPSSAGSSAGGAASAGGSPSSSGSSATPEILYGSVVVSLVAPSLENEGYASVLGRFFDGPTPSAIPLELDTELGACQLRVPSNPFCNTPCAPEVCTADDVCTKYPEPLAVGSLSIEGLGMPLTMGPSTSLSVYQSPSLPYPPCNEGETVTVTAAAFAFEAKCIAPLELMGPDPIPVSAGAPVRLTWMAAASTATSRIRIGLDLAHHGGKKGQIDCEVPDTGAFEIPESLVTKLVGLGLAGFPTISVSRVSVASDPSLPNLELLISQSRTRAIDSGVVSCLDDVECTSPEVCRADRTCGPD